MLKYTNIELQRTAGLSQAIAARHETGKRAFAKPATTQEEKDFQAKQASKQALLQTIVDDTKRIYHLMGYVNEAFDAIAKLDQKN